MGLSLRTGKLLPWLTLILLFCRCSDVKGIKERYQAERAFYRANKIYQSIQVTPGSAGPSAFRQARESFRHLLTTYPVASLQAEDRFPEKIRRELMILVGASRMNVADLFFQEGRIDSAIIEYRRVVADHGAERGLGPRAQHFIALGYQTLGKWEDAVSAFEVLLRDYPPYMETPEQPDMSILQVPVHIAQTYQGRGEKAEAERYYQRARGYFAGVIEQWPASACAEIAQNQIAVTYLRQERWREAISALEPLVAANADSTNPAKASFAIAAVYSDQLQEPEKALQIYADIIEQYPDSKELSRAHLARAQIYMQRGELVKSREEYRRVLTAFPEDAAAGARAQFSLALTYEMEGDWEKALNEFRWIMDNYPASPQALQVPIHILDHYLQFEEDQLASSAYTQALRDYTKFIDKNRDSPQAAAGQWYIAQCHIKMENWQEAISSFEVLVADYPQSAQAPLSLLTMGEIFEAQLKQPEDALRTYQRLVEAYPQAQLSQLAFQRMEKLRQEAQ